MSNTLSLIAQEHAKENGESDLAFEDRMVEKAYWQLHGKKKLTKEEQAEFAELEKKLGVRLALRTGAIPVATTDLQLKPAADRLHQELMDTYKGDTPLKRLLIDRIVAAWSMAFSYERMFHGTKYRSNEDDTRCSFEYGRDKTRYLKEVRHGIETANDQIVRLTQTLQNICNPPIQVKAKNAFFAQNQQINQGIPPRDLEKDSPRPHGEISLG